MNGMLQRIYAALMAQQAMAPQPQSRMGVNGAVLPNLLQVVKRTPSTGVRG
jgi:hypothetical protein